MEPGGGRIDSTKGFAPDASPELADVVFEAVEEVDSTLPRWRGSRWIIVWIVASILIGVSGYAVGRSLHSPWESAVDNSRKQLVVTATVEARTFTPQTATAEGVLQLGTVQDYPVVGGGEGATQVVTQTYVSAGSSVRSGQPILGVNGSPVFGLRLPFALYKDLKPGDDDIAVREVQTALQDSGFFRGRVDGKYGITTATAVRRMYAEADADPPQADPSVVQAATQAKAAYEAARKQTPPATGATLSTLRDAASAAQLAAATPLPASAIAKMTADEALVVQISPVGTELAGGVSAFKLRFGAPTVTARVTVDIADSFKPNATIDVARADDSSRTFKATITHVSEFKPADDKNPDPGYDLQASVQPGADLSGIDDSTRVVARTSSGGEQKGLSVPTTAIRNDRNGTYVIGYVDGEGAPPRYSVQVIALDDGYSVLANNADLKPGMRVVVTDKWARSSVSGRCTRNTPLLRE